MTQRTTTMAQILANVPDETLLEAMVQPAQNRMQCWEQALARHRDHATFRAQTWAISREIGFTCECTGEEQEWRLSISNLRDALPATRRQIERLNGLVHVRTRRAIKLLEKGSKRAKALLHRFLTKQQRLDLRAAKYFDVVVAGRTFRITEGSAGNVFLQGDPAYRLCVVSVPEQPIPVYDLMLAQKVMIESDLGRFLTLAVAWNTTTRQRFASAAFLINGEPEPPVEAQPPPIPREHILEPGQWARAQLGARP